VAGLDTLAVNASADADEIEDKDRIIYVNIEDNIELKINLFITRVTVQWTYITVPNSVWEEDTADIGR